MKKILMMVAACCLIFTACNNKPAETEEAPATDSTEQVVEQPAEACCPMMQDWADFDNKTVEEQTALIEKRGECITKKLAEVNLDEIECPKAKAELPKFIEKWNKTFATADQATKKALIDEFDTFKCLKHHEGGCCEAQSKCEKEQCANCKDECKGNCACKKAEK